MIRFASLVAGCLAWSSAAQTEGPVPDEADLVPTHAEAAVIFAKGLGLFDRYVQPDASPAECVSFLNNTGVYFGLLEVGRGVEFTVQDCARVMGQLSLLFSGEAEYVAGKVMLPKNVDSWEIYCILNDVKYTQGYKSLMIGVGYYRSSINL